MALIQTIAQGDFINAFEQSSRKDQFSSEALEAIFNYLDTISEETGQDIELDIVAICCEWAEMTWQEVAMSYDIDLAHCDDDDERIGEVEDYLSRNTQFCELSDGNFVFIQF